MAGVWVAIVAVCMAHVPATVAAAVTATVSNAYETSGSRPVQLDSAFEVGLLRLEMVNSGPGAAKAQVSLPAQSEMIDIDLPAGARKRLMLYASVPGPVVVRESGRALVEGYASPSDGRPTILVVTTKETGLRALEQEADGQKNIAGLRVLTARPEELPPAWFAYPQAPPGLTQHPFLMVVHPGGFDAMDADQKVALRLRAKHFCGLVLASEGRPDAFKGTPLEGLEPVTDQRATSFAGWARLLRGARDGESAVVRAEPEPGANVLDRTPDGIPIAVTRKERRYSTTWLAFDDDAPPLRNWDRRSFYQALMPPMLPRTPGYELAISVRETLVSRARGVGPSGGALAAAGAALLAGWAAFVLASLPLRASPTDPRRWLLAPAAGAAVLAAGVGGAALWRQLNPQPVAWEVTSGRLMAGGVVLRQGTAALSDDPGVDGLKLAGPQAMFQFDKLTNGTGARLVLEPGFPVLPRVRSATGVGGAEIEMAIDAYPVEGGVSVSAEATTASVDIGLKIVNGTELTLKEPTVFVLGQWVELKDLAPGERRTENLFLAPPPKSASGSPGIVPKRSRRASLVRASRMGPSSLSGMTVEPDFTDREALQALGCDATRQLPLPAGLMLARVDGPGLGAPAGSSKHYLVIDLEAAK